MAVTGGILLIGYSDTCRDRIQSQLLRFYKGSYAKGPEIVSCALIANVAPSQRRLARMSNLIIEVKPHRGEA